MDDPGNVPKPVRKNEIELFRLLERAKLLPYYPAFLAKGGDDVTQLYDASDKEFAEIMDLVGMTGKPLHIRRLQKSLIEWKNAPDVFKSPVQPDLSSEIFCQISPPTSSHEASFKRSGQNSATAKPRDVFMQMPSGMPMPMLPHFPPFPPISNSSYSGHQVHNFHSFPPPPSLTFGGPDVFTTPTGGSCSQSAGASVEASISPSLRPDQAFNNVRYTAANYALSGEEMQAIQVCAEKFLRLLPQYPIKPSMRTKKLNHKLSELINLPMNHPGRSDLIRRFAAIFGRFDSPRKYALSQHEVQVNEAAAQLCMRQPNLLSRREDLYPLARQVVKLAERGQLSRQQAPAKFESNVSIELRLQSLKRKITVACQELSALIMQYDQIYIFARSVRSNSEVWQNMMPMVQKKITFVSSQHQYKLEELSTLILDYWNWRRMLPQSDYDSTVGGMEFSTLNSDLPLAINFSPTSQQQAMFFPGAETASNPDGNGPANLDPPAVQIKAELAGDEFYFHENKCSSANVPPFTVGQTYIKEEESEDHYAYSYFKAEDHSLTLVDTEMLNNGQPNSTNSIFNPNNEILESLDCEVEEEEEGTDEDMKPPVDVPFNPENEILMSFNEAEHLKKLEIDQRPISNEDGELAVVEDDRSSSLKTPPHVDD